MCAALPNIMAIIIIAIGNILIGGLVGMTGVAGFLLPILYTAGLGYSTTEGLAFSFLAFIISGWLGSRIRHCYFDPTTPPAKTRRRSLESTGFARHPRRYHWIDLCPFRSRRPGTGHAATRFTRL